MEATSQSQNLEGRTAQKREVVDIGINLTNRAFRSHWKEVVQRAIDNGVTRMVLTGTSIKTSRESLALAQKWYEETGTANLYVTIGIHPHDAKSWENGNGDTRISTLEQMNEMLQHPLAVAVGECGLDYNRNFSSKQDQIHAFKEQVKLAVELDMPLFLHEREAHHDLVQTLDIVQKENVERNLPQIVVHCFTGTEKEAETYVERGYYLGFTGTICKTQRGAPLREFLPKIPLDKVMVETDAPFMGFKKGRRGSEPSDCADVANQLSKTMKVPLALVCETTTKNATTFFRIPST
mmetsp:Transcript_22989/g.33934  ORF Transcript_22989/g.33934 Transcript_22989/m.33934 type:complete len:294 (-) Transcript_22989:562-1443(-)|eukprot:CAMPEP_0194217812 /NCGR_PEP_ID=MMETSP0156-20130528/22307_1 /TAXON_ID=33649 /ORGANISM="Thalassionema nitzschioides, Strain L26-B" /LENGTH=293 /DNA_ID=CAMNT_0038946953 /DNA_START=28 /DNA_END=909 /DNA_ORIENTATION=+